MPPSDQKANTHNIRSTLRPPKRYHAHDGRQMEQAGRSATNLNAQASAQTLRKPFRVASRDPTPSSSSSESLESTGIPLATSDMPTSKRSDRNAHQSLRGPLVPSPVNLAPSASRNTKAQRRNGHHYCLESSVSSSGQQHMVLVTRPSATTQQASATPSLSRPVEMSQTNSTTHVAKLSAPRSVRELGSDYSRYFNPFASQSHSQQDLSTLLPRYNTSFTPSDSNHAVSAKNLAKRLSDPFKDDRRLSNPFDSAENISAEATGKPGRSDLAEKGPVVAEATLPPRSGTPIPASDTNPMKVLFHPVDDRLGAPLEFPLYVDQREDDDEMHMPQWDDDRRYKPKWRDQFWRENLVNTIGVIMLLTGLFTVFVVLPIISYTGTSLIPYSYETPLDQMPGNAVDPWTHVNDREYPLLQNIRTGLIDPDTPTNAMKRHSANGDNLVLVFSDEFNAKNRTFYHGDDPFWFAPDIWYGATQDLEWYDPDAVNTGDGTLQLQLDAFLNHGLGYRSGMLNSWNQVCFKGGVFEVSMSLPGPAGVHGLWPGAWTMGNLGKPGHLATTDGVWPYTYNSCDVGITPNQSQSDGLSFLPGQRLANCVCDREEHPSPGTGRGAPEIDIAEVSGDWSGLGIGVATQSFQVAPFDIWYRPNYDFMETPNYNISSVNTWTGGPYQQAVSTTTMLNNDWYDGIQYQKYSFEYVPGTTDDSHITWYVGDEETMKFDARAIGPNGNVAQRVVSEEPMSIVLNLGFSHNWVDIDMANLRFPTVMRIDYVRWYQKEGEEMVTCDPPGYETTSYIAAHPVAYNNPNLTHWEQTGYPWPKNSLMNDCST